jgi:choline dehydrogenase-like flavoprotein
VVGYVIAAAVMQPFSRGNVRLSGPDAGAPPIIDPNYLGDDRDLRTLVTALRLARQIGEASAYDPWRSTEAAPGPAAGDDDALGAFVKAAFQSYFHPVGTCAMGDTDMSVVDSELRVHAISGVRVAGCWRLPGPGELDNDEGERSDEHEAHDGTNHRRWPRPQALFAAQ